VRFYAAICVDTNGASGERRQEKRATSKAGAWEPGITACHHFANHHSAQSIGKTMRGKTMRGPRSAHEHRKSAEVFRFLRGLLFKKQLDPAFRKKRTKDRNDNKKNYTETMRITAGVFLSVSSVFSVVRNTCFEFGNHRRYRRVTASHLNLIILPTIILPRVLAK